MRILAIDPGYERLGIAVLEKLPGQKELLLYSACVQTSKTLPQAERFLVIADFIKKIIVSHTPDALATETVMFGKNRKTATAVAGARGVIIAEAARAKLPVFEYGPQQVKMAVTSYGRSDKKNVGVMVKNLLSIRKKNMLDDELDAIAIGLTYLASQAISLRVLGA